MKKVYLFALAMALAPLGAVAQQPDTQAVGGPQAPAQDDQRPGGRPSTYDQACNVREQLGLSQDSFFKVYEAYSKYNKAVFGDDSSKSNSGSAPQGGRPGGGMGGPGGGMGGPGGGMGGPGGGMGGPGGGMGGPGGGPGGQMGGMPSSSHKDNNKAPKPLTEKQILKLQKKMEKQETKLCKNMRKILGSDELYNQWLEIREQQKPRSVPGMPPAQPFAQPQQ